MSAKSVTVADACRMIADRTGDQQAAHILRQAGDELDRLTAELEKHQPEERAGKCGCGDWEWNSDDGGFWCFEVDPIWGAESFGGAPRRCSSCDWELCTDGVARRNADTARVQRVRQVLDAVTKNSVTGCDGFIVSRTQWIPAAAIRAALDTPGDPEVGDGG